MVDRPGAAAERTARMNSPAPAWPGIGELRQQIEAELEATFSNCPQTEVMRAARYVTQGGGQRWRGALAVAAGAIFQPDALAATLPLAAALEIMHAASLVVDDLPSMDHAQTRRGKPCVHLVFPPWVVDMLPAFLVNLAYHVAAQNTRVPTENRLRCLLLLGEMGMNLAQGQELDLALTGQEATLAQVVNCHTLKSGSLFAAATAGGALLCGASDDDAATLRNAGMKLGLTYQIMDDLADSDNEQADVAGKSGIWTCCTPQEARALAAEQLAAALSLLTPFGPPATALRALTAEIFSGPRHLPA